MLSDSNISDDSDGVAIDFNTNIAVISNEFDDSATVLNLTGSSFSGTTPSCMATEGGTPPNSVLITDLPSDIAGSAVNPETHEAFLITDEDDGIVLVTLPSSPVSQLDSSMVSSSVSSIPSTPANGSFDAQGDPYAVAIDVCNNVGYAVDDNSEWLVGIDLATLRDDPDSIALSLPSGSCAGTSTSLACSNGSGTKFFPLPPVSE